MSALLSLENTAIVLDSTCDPPGFFDGAACTWCR